MHPICSDITWHVAAGKQLCIIESECKLKNQITSWAYYENTVELKDAPEMEVVFRSTLRSAELAHFRPCSFCLPSFLPECSARILLQWHFPNPIFYLFCIAYIIILTLGFVVFSFCVYLCLIYTAVHVLRNVPWLTFFLILIELGSKCC